MKLLIYFYWFINDNYINVQILYFLSAYYFEGII